MKVLLINGSPNEHGCTFTALNEVSESMKRRGIEGVYEYKREEWVATNFIR